MPPQSPRSPHSSATSQPHTIDPNPYAPSAVVEPYDRRDYYGDLPQEVGLWRDGQLIVLHVEAVWPAICVKTGEPAVRSHTVKITRLVPGSSWIFEEVEFEVPLGARWHWLVSRFRWGVFAVGLSLFPGSILVAALSARPFPVQLMGAALIATFVTLVFGGMLGEILVLRFSRGNYLWLGGAREPFLAQLPPWPPDRSQ